MPMFMRKIVRTLSLWSLCAFCLCSLWRDAQAYTVVIASTAAPAGLEAQFISQTTAQWSGSVIANPLFGDTYQVILYGPNPAYNAPPTTIQQALSLGSTIYSDGWADGESYQQHTDETIVTQFSDNCSTPIGVSTATWDVGTCESLTGAINQKLFEQLLSTPTVVPGN